MLLFNCENRTTPPCHNGQAHDENLRVCAFLQILRYNFGWHRSSPVLHRSSVVGKIVRHLLFLFHLHSNFLHVLLFRVDGTRLIARNWRVGDDSVAKQGSNLFTKNVRTARRRHGVCRHVEQEVDTHSFKVVHYGVGSLKERSCISRIVD